MQLLLNKWTDIDETVHACSIQSWDDVHEKDNPGSKYLKGDNSREPK